MKDLHWLGGSWDTFRGWDRDVQRAAGYQLHLLQAGMDPSDWKPMQGIGPGVREVRIHVNGEYRIIYLAKFEDSVFILHAFRKKSQKTPTKDIAIAKARLKDVLSTRK